MNEQQQQAFTCLVRLFQYGRLRMDERGELRVSPTCEMSDALEMVRSKEQLEGVTVLHIAAYIATLVR